jgi:nicotinamide mononucleotide (NMN) deamidase PncC
MPGPLSSITIDPRFTATEMTGGISASSQASIALSVSSLTMTSGHSSTSWPVWFTSFRRVQNSISRDTVKGTRVSFFFARVAGVS